MKSARIWNDPIIMANPIIFLTFKSSDVSLTFKVYKDFIFL